MKKLNKIGQSVMEYFLIMCVILAAIIGSGFIDKVRSTFNVYYEKAIAQLR